jgi:hypothetical protein
LPVLGEEASDIMIVLDEIAFCSMRHALLPKGPSRTAAAKASA